MSLFLTGGASVGKGCGMGLSREKFNELRERTEREWRENIAPFWMRHAPDERFGGFRGLITNDLRVDEHAEKGVIRNSRILWTFARAYGLYQDDALRRMAERAYAYLTEHFIDH